MHCRLEYLRLQGEAWADAAAYACEHAVMRPSDAKTEALVQGIAVNARLHRLLVTDGTQADVKEVRRKDVTEVRRKGEDGGVVHQSQASVSRNCTLTCAHMAR